MDKVKSEETPKYNKKALANEDNLIDNALSVIKIRLQTKGDFIQSPKDVQNYLTLKMAELEHEVFAVMFLDGGHKLIAYEEMFRGTINGAGVYPREVAKRALQLNASAVIFAHNHPSGEVVPSSADRKITTQLKDSLGLFDVIVLDHIIIGGVDSFSFAEKGYL